MAGRMPTPASTNCGCSCCAWGFAERIRGSHHIFRKDGVRDRLNLQRDGSHAKPYQVRQVRRVVLRHLL